MKKTSIFVILFLVCSVVAYGQSAEDLRVKVKSLTEGKKYNIRYDKTHKQTRIRSPWLKTKNPKSLMFSLSGFFETDVLKNTVNNFYLTFPSNYSQWSYPKNRNLAILVDGERVLFEEGNFGAERFTLNNAHTGTSIDVPMGGEIDFHVRRDVIEKIVNGKDVALEFKGAKRILDDNAKQIFRDMLELTKIE